MGSTDLKIPAHSGFVYENVLGHNMKELGIKQWTVLRVCIEMN